MNAMKLCVSYTAILSLVVVTAACSMGKNADVTSPSPKETSARQTPVKISMFISDHSQPSPTRNVMDNPTIKYLAQKTNTDLNITFFTASNYYDMVKVRLASGDIPDVVQDWQLNPELYTNHKLVALNEYLDKYGQNLKKVIPKEAWDTVTIGGEIYGIPETAQGNALSSRVIYVRKDWMDKVGIKEAPKTPNEFLNMLRAFRDKDPNGNGKKDEIPFSSRADLNWSENLMGMFGVTPFGNHLINGEVIPDIINPQMKQALAFFHTMYQEKLIDSEFLTLQRNVWEQKIQSDLVGSWIHVTDLAWDWQDRLNKSLPGKGADVIAIPTPKAPGVDHVGMEVNAVKKVFNITTSAKDPAAIVKLFEWLVSEEGQEFVTFGILGDTYTKDDGKINYNKMKDTDNKTAGLRVMVFNLIGYNKDLLTVQLGDDAVAKLDASYAISRKEGIPNPVAGMPALTTEQKHPELQRYGSLFLQAAAKIILGEKPVDSFDDFVKTYREQGGNEIIKEMTEWYNANRK